MILKFENVTIYKRDYKKERRRVGNNNELRNTSVNNKKRKREKSLGNIRNTSKRLLD